MVFMQGWQVEIVIPFDKVLCAKPVDGECVVVMTSSLVRSSQRFVRLGDSSHVSRQSQCNRVTNHIHLGVHQLGALGT